MLASCTQKKTFDYFTGSDWSFVISFFVLGLSFFCEYITPHGSHVITPPGGQIIITPVAANATYSRLLRCLHSECASKEDNVQIHEYPTRL